MPAVVQLQQDTGGGVEDITRGDFTHFHVGDGDKNACDIMLEPQPRDRTSGLQRDRALLEGAG